MASLAEDYAAAMREKTGHIATWVPTTRLEIGDIIRIQDGLIEPRSHLNDHLSGQIRDQAGGAQGDRLVAQSGVTWRASASAGASVGSGVAEFSRQKAFFFAADRTSERNICDFDEIAREVLKLSTDGLWQDDWLFVTSVISVQAFSTAICSSADATVSCGVDPSIEGIADVRAGGSIAIQKGDALVYVSNSPSTPLYRAYGVERSLVRRRPRISLRRNAPVDTPGEGRVAEVSLDRAGF